MEIHSFGDKKGARALSMQEGTDALFYLVGASGIEPPTTTMSR